MITKWLDFKQILTLVDEAEALVEQPIQQQAIWDQARESIWQLLITIRFEYLDLSPRLRQDEIVNYEFFMCRERLSDLLLRLNQPLRSVAI